MARFPLTPAEPELREGTPFAPTYGDVYHSVHGGIEQARHVFIAGTGLPDRWRGRDGFTVLETGFGLGLNFLATWQAWRSAPRRPRRLHFVSVEKHPLRVADLARMLAPYPELAMLSGRTRRRLAAPGAGLPAPAFRGRRPDPDFVIRRGAGAGSVGAAGGCPVSGWLLACPQSGHVEPRSHAHPGPQGRTRRARGHLERGG